MSNLKRILLIDDDEATNFIHRTYLRKFDPNTLTIAKESGQEALDYLSTITSEDKPQIIFLDINMPGMNGWEFLESYVKLPEPSIKGIKVYVLSTSLNPKDKFQAEDHPFVQGFIPKPLTVDIISELEKRC